MEKIKSFRWIVISLVIVVCIIFVALLYGNYLKKKTYDYKGVFVMENTFRGDIYGYIYKGC